MKLGNTEPTSRTPPKPPPRHVPGKGTAAQLGSGLCHPWATLQRRPSPANQVPGDHPGISGTPYRVETLGNVPEDAIGRLLDTSEPQRSVTEYQTRGALPPHLKGATEARLQRINAVSSEATAGRETCSGGLKQSEAQLGDGDASELTTRRGWEKTTESRLMSGTWPSLQWTAS